MHKDRLHAIARAWFDDFTVTHVFEPLIADWQRECARLTGPARWACRAEGVRAFAITFALTFTRDLVRPLPAGVQSAAWGAVGAFAAAGTLLALLPFGSQLWATRGDLLIPSALLLALPAAMTPALLALLSSRRWPQPVARRAAVRVSAVVFAMLVILAGWVAPTANQAWREDRVVGLSSAGVPTVVARGARELTLPELAAPTPPTDVRVTEWSRRYEWQLRLAIVFSPILLLAVAVMVATREATGREQSRLRRLASASGWWLAFPGALLAMSWLGPAVDAPPLQWWLPHLLLLLAAVLSRGARRPPVAAPGA